MTKIFSLPILFAALAAFLVLAPASYAQASMKEVYNQAVADFNGGKLDEAEAGFQKVLKANPRYVYAKKYLVSIQQKRAAGDTTTTTIEGKVKSIVLETVEFDGASLKDVMAYLSQKAEQSTGGAFTPNFVYRGTAEQAQQPVTLKLRNVPMTDVINYVGQTTGTRFSYDKYAVIGIPTSKAAPAAATQASSGPVTNTFD